MHGRSLDFQLNIVVVVVVVVIALFCSYFSFHCPSIRLKRMRLCVFARCMYMVICSIISLFVCWLYVRRLRATVCMLVYVRYTSPSPMSILFSLSLSHGLLKSFHWISRWNTLSSAYIVLHQFFSMTFDHIISIFIVSIQTMQTNDKSAPKKCDMYNQLMRWYEVYSFW